MKQAFKYIGLALCCLLVTALVIAQTPMGPIRVMGYALFPNDGARIADTNASHYLRLRPGSNITADRDLTLTTGDADRTMTFTDNVTLPQTTVSGNAGTATAALGLKTASTTVDVQTATSPTSGQVLTATSSTAATWQSPASGPANSWTWQPEGSDDASKHQYADINDMFDALAAASLPGIATVFIDPTETTDGYTVTWPARTPSGNYEMRNVIVECDSVNWAHVNFADGAVLDDASQIGSRIEYESHSTAPVITSLTFPFIVEESAGITHASNSYAPLLHNDTPNEFYLIFRTTAYVYSSGPTTAAIKATDGKLTLGLHDATVLGTSIVELTGDAHGYFLPRGTGAFVYADSITGSAGTTLEWVLNGTGDYDATQTAFVGTTISYRGLHPEQAHDADLGDVSVSSGAWSIDSAAVSLAKMASLAQDQFIGRTTASTGVPETATITSAARTVLDDTTVGAMVDTLGGASATGSGGLARATTPTLVKPTALKYNVTPLATAYSASLSLDVSANNDHEIGTLTGNLAITFTSGADGDSGIVIVKMGGSGSYTVSFAAGGRTVVKDSSLSDTNPGTAAGTVTIYSYAFYTVGGTAYVVVNKSILA